MLFGNLILLVICPSSGSQPNKEAAARGREREREEEEKKRASFDYTNPV